jgi:hypothetical protein
MIIKSCLNCEFHDVKLEFKEELSYCRRENCWSQYSKCVAIRALNQFLKQESCDCAGPLSTSGQAYSGK